MILWEWVDLRGVGAMSGRIPLGQGARIDERLDRIEELEILTHERCEGYIYPFRKHLKKIKVRGSVAWRPILVLGPVDKEHEITFLYLAQERDKVLLPSGREVEAIANRRLEEILGDKKRRRRYVRS